MCVKVGNVILNTDNQISTFSFFNSAFMTHNYIDIIFVVDISTTDKSVMAAIKENIGEIMSDLHIFINRISIICFSNSPTVIYEFLKTDSLDTSSLDSECGGMCNVHFALKETCRLIESSHENLVYVLLFQTSDPTDSIRLLDEENRKTLADAAKYLIKRTSTLLEPAGFNGNRSYILGSEQDIKRLIQDVEDSCSVSDSDEIAQPSQDIHQDKEPTTDLEDEEEEQIAFNPNEESSETSNESEIKSPEIEQSIYS